MLFFKLALVFLCVCLVCYSVLNFSVIESVKIFAFGIFISIMTTVAYPEIRGIKKGDVVSVVTDSTALALFGRSGIAANNSRKKQEIKILFSNGTEVIGIVESYSGIISPPKIRLLYEEKPVG